jgi:hypothetical protein
MKTIAALVRAPIAAFRRRYNKDIGNPLPESVAKRQKTG